MPTAIRANLLGCKDLFKSLDAPTGAPSDSPKPFRSNILARLIRAQLSNLGLLLVNQRFGVLFREMPIYPFKTFLKLALTYSVLSNSLSATLDIVPLGDSITQGRGGDRPVYSWRYPLWQMLVDAEVDFDFVGSLDSGFNSNPDWEDYRGLSFDPDHEGHWGWETDKVRDHLDGWLSGYTPDIAIILLGTNDERDYSNSMPNRNAVFAAETAEEHREIIDLLRADNPNVSILLGGAFQGWDPFPDLRDALEELAGEESTENSPIVYVDQSPGWVSNPNSSNADTVDYVHPNQKGDAKLAERWFAALTPLLPQTYGLWKYLALPNDFAGAAAEATADFDQDGIPNLMEYALDCNPAESTPPSALPEAMVEDGIMTFRFFRDLERVSVRYLVEGSTNLVDWDDVVYDSAVDAETNNRAGLIEVTKDLPVDTPYFMRLRVEQLDSL